ncbi:hypothetical protein DV737_g570, partial [Chaetothyriales sp. CBS 132003]
MSASLFRDTFSPACAPPLPPFPKKPQADHTDARQLGCTHQKMTRLYDKYGATPCSVCRRHPALGWLYRCTQDTDGSLPQSDFGDGPPVKPATPSSSRATPFSSPATPSSSRASPFSSAPTPSSSPPTPSSPADPYLSPAALKATPPGQHNNEQDPQLVHQNDEAVQSPVQHGTRPTSRSSTAQESITCSSIPESTTFSTIATSANVDEELQAVYDWPALCKVWEADHSPLVLGDEDQVEQHPVSVCGFRICPACRPTYRDRAMQSVDGILNKPKVPPKWELDNRRVSDARVLRTIGLPKSRRFNTQTAPGAIPAQKYACLSTPTPAAPP